MRESRDQSVPLSATPQEVFAAALGVAQSGTKDQILAVHNEGRKVIFRGKAMFSNPKFFFIWVEEHNGASVLHVTVGTDPRTPKALLDGKINTKALAGYVEKVQAALTGSAPVSVSPVTNHYLRQTELVPWQDHNELPDIELGGDFKAAFGY